jgi:cobalt-zinc-cadmium efflux system outer membrane protein
MRLGDIGVIYSTVLRHGMSAAIAVSLVGCSQLPADRGWADVMTLVAARHHDLATQPHVLNMPSAEIQRQINTLLAKPLNADRAVAVALLRNPVIKLEYAKLGLVQADVLEASRLSNPVLSFGTMQSDAAVSRTRFDYGLVQNFTNLLFLHTRSQAAQLDVQRAKANTGAALQNLAADVSRAYYQLAHAEHTAQMQLVMAKAASTSSRLAQQFYTAGNINALALSREQAVATQAQLDWESAQTAVNTARSTLRNSMGLRLAEDQWSIQKQLPLPVAQEDSLERLHEMALNNRLDLAAKRKEAEAYAHVLGLSQRLQWLPFVEVGAQGERDSDGARLLGPTVAIEIPIFGQNRAGMLRAQARFEQASAEAEELAADVSNQVNTVYSQMLAARVRVQRYQTELIPQREAVVARTVELHNYMMVGTFDLLLAKQQEYDAYRGQLQALSDYWLTRTELAREVGATLPSDTQSDQPSVGAITLPDRAAPSTEHAGHHMQQQDMAEMDHHSMSMPDPATNHDLSDMSDMDHTSMAGMQHQPTTSITMPAYRSTIPRKTQHIHPPQPKRITPHPPVSKQQRPTPSQPLHDMSDMNMEGM